ncbi:serine hydrolase domain-containing protein [Cytophaga aurantiaca]|uniref:serine hydrolase domain-containing protein n=1 Tax=Cytophaga aurantiaca TaxID=29530 RepID=UPI00036E64B8|nr:serine hydrolase [Cytophaga aurantiaca]
MKRKIIIGIGILILAIIFTLQLTNKNYYYKTLWYNMPGIFDKDIFESRTIQTSAQQQNWSYAFGYSGNTISKELVDSLKKYEAISLLFIQHDSILIEKYFEGAGDSTRSNSFSVSKSFIGALIGRAIKLGFIKSIDQPVADYIPEFKEGEKSKITIRHLLTMSSGLDWDEAYSSLFSQTTEAYYGTELEKQVLSLSVKKQPGKYFEYKSCDTEILAILLQRTTGMNVSEFLSKELWGQMGASEASWSLDHTNGIEKAYCCMYATAKDYARLGSLYLHKGNWKGQQLIDSSYIRQSVTATGLLDPKTEKPTNCYGFQWWIVNDYKGISAFYMRGILGQNVVVIPSMDMIVVRMGHKRGAKIGMHYTEMYALLDEALRIK